MQDAEAFSGLSWKESRDALKQHLLCARHYDTRFPYIISFNHRETLWALWFRSLLITEGEVRGVTASVSHGHFHSGKSVCSVSGLTPHLLPP